MKIAAIQSKKNFWYDTNSRNDYPLSKCIALRDEFMEKEFLLIEQALKEGNDLVVTIEAFNASINLDDNRYDFSEVCEPLDGELMARFCDLSKKYGAYIVAGLYTTKDKKAYNSACLFSPDGRLAQVHNKVHLPAGEELSITHGDSYRIFKTPFGNIGMLVCWDLQFPEAARELALMGADIICCPTWGCEDIYVRCRAYENSITLAIAMGVCSDSEIWEGCDPSCIIDNMGNISAIGTREGSQIVSCELDIKKEPAPQYGSERYTKHSSMRRTRLTQRRPDSYKQITEKIPPLYKRYTI